MHRKVTINGREVIGTGKTVDREVDGESNKAGLQWRRDFRRI